MSNVLVRKEPQQSRNLAQPTPGYEFDPFRLMRSMLGWDPFREMAPAYNEVDRGGFAPAFEIRETKNGYVFKADVPGIKDADLEITVTGNRLTVAGKRESERDDKGDRYYSYERCYGSFSRSFTLPEGTEMSAVAADLREGVLTLNLPKKPEVQAKKIEIKPTVQRS